LFLPSQVSFGQQSLSGAISIKGADVSIREPLSQTKVIWGLFLGFFFLQEAFTLQRTFGAILIFIGTGFLLWHPEKRFGKLNDPGVRWTFCAAVLGAIVAAVDKYAQNWFAPEMYGFFVYFVPLIVLLAFLPRRAHHIQHLLKRRGASTIIAILISVGVYYFNLKAFTVADYTVVYPLIQLSTLLTVIGGILFFKEHEHFWQRIIATILTIAGVILIGI
jgi:drug/metabolite transporter (DMT)-like permease